MGQDEMGTRRDGGKTRRGQDEMGASRRDGENTYRIVQSQWHFSIQTDVGEKTIEVNLVRN